jgi:hypothetical protein
LYWRGVIVSCPAYSTMTMTPNDKAVKECCGLLFLFTEKPRRVSSETQCPRGQNLSCLKGYSILPFSNSLMPSAHPGYRDRGQGWLQFIALRSISQEVSQEVAHQDHSRCPDTPSYSVVEEKGSPVHPVYTGQEPSIRLNTGDKAH